MWTTGMGPKEQPPWSHPQATSIERGQKKPSVSSTQFTTVLRDSYFLLSTHWSQTHNRINSKIQKSKIFSFQDCLHCHPQFSSEKRILSKACPRFQTPTLRESTHWKDNHSSRCSHKTYSGLNKTQIVCGAQRVIHNRTTELKAVSVYGEHRSKHCLKRS